MITFAQGYLLREPAGDRTSMHIIPDFLVSHALATSVTQIECSSRMSAWLYHALAGFYESSPEYCCLSRLDYLNTADRFSSRFVEHFIGATPVNASIVRKSPDSTSEGDGRVDFQGMLNEIISGLGITYDQLAQITGIGRTTLFYWRRGEASPRASNLHQVMRLHALVSLLVKRFGNNGATSWLQLANPERWDRLIHGDLVWVEREVRTELMRQHAPLTKSKEVTAEESYYEPSVQEDAPVPRRVLRKSVKRRLGESDR